MPVYYTQEDIDEYEMDQDRLGEYDEDGTYLSYEAAKDNVAYELMAKGWQNIDECDDNRSYPTSLFSEKTKTIGIGDVCIYVTVKVGCTSGYYEASIFDWLAKVKVYGLFDGYYDDFLYEADELEAGDVIRDNWYGNKGLSKIHAAHIIRKIESIIDELKNEAELAFSMYCDEELYCTYQFSNGEVDYNQTGKRLWQELEKRINNN